MMTRPAVIQVERALQGLKPEVLLQIEEFIDGVQAAEMFNGGLREAEVGQFGVGPRHEQLAGTRSLLLIGPLDIGIGRQFINLNQLPVLIEGDLHALGSVLNLVGTVEEDDDCPV